MMYSKMNYMKNLWINQHCCHLKLYVHHAKGGNFNVHVYMFLQNICETPCSVFVFYNLINHK